MTPPATVGTRRFGAGLYTGQRPGGATYRDAVPLAVAAEEAGFDSFWVSEHHGLPDGYLPSPLTLLAALAPATSRITLGTGLLLAPLHHPLRIAEDAAVVDVLSGGRLVLGLGLGYAEHEYAAFGVDPAERGTRLDALVRALRTAWTGEPVHCDVLGLSGARVTPVPRRRIPVWLGGYAARAVRRAGLLADGHLTGLGTTAVVRDASAHLAGVLDPAAPDFTRAVTVACVLDAPGGGAAAARAAFTRQQLVYERMQAGREVYAGLVADPGGADPGLVADPGGADPGSTGRPARGGIDAYVQASGSADEVVAALTGLLDALADWPDVHLVLRLLFSDTDLDVQRRRLAAFGRDVLPRLRAHVPGGAP